MERSCAHCGASFTAQRSSARFCGGRCRAQAAAERAKGRVVAQEAAPADTAPLGRPSNLLEAVRGLLAASGALATPAGRLCEVLAVRVASGEEAGAALASLSRELRAALAAATAGTRSAADPVDELRARREARRRVEGGS